MKTIIKIFIVFMILLLTSAFFSYVPVYANSEPVAAKIAEDGVRLRKENNTSSKILALMAKNDEVTVLEKTGEWYKVVFGNLTGYVLGTYLIIPGEQTAVIESAPVPLAAVGSGPSPGVVNENNVNLRSDASTGASIVAVMKKGTLLSVTDSSGEWYGVVSDGKPGFILGKYISLTDDVEAVINSSSEPGVINDHGVNLRAEGSMDAQILTRLAKGTKLNVYERTGDWYRVDAGDWAGFVFNEYVTLAESIESINDVGMINASNVNLRAENNTNSEVLAVLDLNTPLTVLDKFDDWYKVKALGQTGYTSGSYVTLGEVPKQASQPSQAVAAQPNNIVFTGGGPTELVDWWNEGKSIMKPGVKAIVTDVATNISFEVKVLANGNHADVEPLTASDTASILQIRGSYSWTPRAVRVTVNGRTMAASVNGMPHDVSTIKDNNFPGHFCMHFYNSRNHYNNSLDAGHQNQVAIAYNN